MRLVVIDAARRTYRVFEGRTFIAEYTSVDRPATAEEVEEIRLASAPPLEAA